MDPLLLPSISLRDLSRQPGPLVERVSNGERFVVTRYGRPVATLQPIDGHVTDPLRGTYTDVCGGPMGSPATEAEKLSDVERQLLAGAHPLFNRITYGLSDSDGRAEGQAMRSLSLRGLARRTKRGLILPGRGMVLKEWLRQQGVRSARESQPGPQPN